MREMANNTKYQTIFVAMAIVTVFGLLGLVVIEEVLTPQIAEARGCRTQPPFDASQGRCFGH